MVTSSKRFRPRRKPVIAPEVLRALKMEGEEEDEMGMSVDVDTSVDLDVKLDGGSVGGQGGMDVDLEGPTNSNRVVEHVKKENLVSSFGRVKVEPAEGVTIQQETRQSLHPICYVLLPTLEQVLRRYRRERVVKKEEDVEEAMVVEEDKVVGKKEEEEERKVNVANGLSGPLIKTDSEPLHESEDTVHIVKHEAGTTDLPTPPASESVSSQRGSLSPEIEIVEWKPRIKTEPNRAGLGDSTSSSTRNTNKRARRSEERDFGDVVRRKKVKREPSACDLDDSDTVQASPPAKTSPRRKLKKTQSVQRQSGVTETIAERELSPEIGLPFQSPASRALDVQVTTTAFVDLSEEGEVKTQERTISHPIAGPSGGTRASPARKARASKEEPVVAPVVKREASPEIDLAFGEEQLPQAIAGTNDAGAAGDHPRVQEETPPDDSRVLKQAATSAAPLTQQQREEIEKTWKTKASRLRSTLSLQGKKVKNENAQLHKSIIWSRLQQNGVSPELFEIEFDQDMLHLAVPRLFISNTYGGSMQCTFPRISGDKLREHGLDDWFFLPLDYQPEAPEIPGAPGLCQTDFVQKYNEWKKRPSKTKKSASNGKAGSSKKTSSGKSSTKAKSPKKQSASPVKRESEEQGP
ncbi:hypothetical protein CC1G_06642 [Coprinopsis cinerea okayama7|uniref:DUF6697 domain-containing protein n=1 Tax=Coprinopsis cinerea (strain Okayama-7 / 130 / ATCC MYA-4618 / FGSC 9003) TaxID=240176 RepID=A8P7U7_COPC7|nr:hypothetical protein CC1G_06642 [Coprinopsis cinerea okayama7\|eukprot:XP_001839429.2 hypothetical protein CC1G_06642 [Coprinopsis cinerea okayama7\